MKNILLLNYLRVPLLALTIFVIAVGCGGGDSGTTVDNSETPVVDKVPADTPAETTDVTPATIEAEVPAITSAPAVATLTGTVTLNGTPPEMPVIAMTSDPKCHVGHGDIPLKSDRVLCGANGGLQNVFISIVNPPAGDYAVPEAPVVLDQIGCMYTPHVVGVQVKQKLEIRNSDPTLHNVHRVAKANGGDNRMQMPNSQPLIHTFDIAEERMRYKCDVHPWMNSFVFVKDNPFFAVTDKDGAFNIAGLPTGEYEVKAWHEHYKEQTGKVSVDASGTGSIDFTYTAE